MIYKNISSIINSIKKSQPGTLTFICNICGAFCNCLVDSLDREEPSCFTCGSTVRMRSIVNAVSLSVFNEGLSIKDMPSKPELKIIGLSDWVGYADRFARKFNYTNTYYHKPPKLDIMNIESHLWGTLDILISSDVFEHVASPVSLAFRNSYNMLRDNGSLILTVPYVLEGETREHFNNLHEYRIDEQDDEKVLINTMPSGERQVYKNLVFHGGEGDTLEMRLFSKQSLLSDLEEVGFKLVKIISDPIFKYGIYHKSQCSLPIIAYK